MTTIDMRLGASQGLVSTAFRAEAKAVVTELAFVKRTKHLADGLLNKTVNNGRNTSLTFLTSILGNFNPPDGIGTIATLQQRVYQFVFMEFQLRK